MKTRNPKTKAAKHKRLSFAEQARALGCSENEKAFDAALKKIAKATPAKAEKKAKKPAK